MIATVKALGALMDEARRALLAGVALAMLQAALMVPLALVVKLSFDELIPEERVGALALAGVGLILLGGASAGVALWTRYFVLAVTKRAMLRLRSRLFEKLYSLPSAWFGSSDLRKVHSVLVQDSERVDVAATALAGSLAPSAVVGVALAAAMVVISPLLFAVLAVSLPPVLVVAARVGPIVRSRVRAWQESYDRFSGRAHFALRARDLIRAQGVERTELSDAREEAEELSELGRRMAFAQHAYSQLTVAAAAASGAVLLVVGGAAVAAGTTSLGALIAFYALVGMLRSQVAKALTAAPQVIAGGASLERLEDFLAAEAPQPYAAGGRTIDFSGRIEVRDLRFSYRPGEPVLTGVDLELGAGDRVALIGPNGAGKSTLAALLLGLYEPDRGDLLADGVSYRELDVVALRRQIAIVPQPPILFGGTIAENIAFGSPGADRAAIVEAARLSTAHRFIEELRDGYETEVGTEGELLSGGQRQRIAIARALLRHPSLLILDEPTSGLDRDSTATLIEAIGRLPRDPAVLLMTHDRDVEEAADRVYELRGGRASEQLGVELPS